MWIDNSLHKPIKPGFYICLVDVDGFGNLAEVSNELFEEKDWSHTKSHRQFIKYWKATSEEYSILSRKTEKEFDDYLESYIVE